MKTFTKIGLLAMVMLLPTFIIAQESLDNFTGKTAPDKQVFIQQLHGITQDVPVAIAGEGKPVGVGFDCSDPILIEDTDLPYSVSQTTEFSGNNYDNTCLNDFDGGNDLIYQFILAEDTTLTFELDPKGTPYSGFALNEQCFDDPTVTCLAVSTDTYGTGEAHGFAVALEAGTYYIMVDSWPTSKTTFIPDFNLNIDFTVPVPNDECANAIEVNEVLGLFFNTEEATGSGAATGGSNIWYKYTATVTGDVVVSTCGSLFDTQLAIWDACGGIDFLFNDDNCGYNGTQSSVTITGVTAGDEYWIEIGGYYGATGIGYLDIYLDESGCDLVCPTNGMPEGEICGEDINGGCNMGTPAFTSVSDGDTVCGSTWAVDYERDTDWFEIEITEVSNIKLSVIGEDDMIFGMIAQIEMGGEGCENMYNYFAGYNTTPACIEDSIEFACLPVGTYYFMVASNTFLGQPCFDYQAAFTVDANPYGTISGTVDDGAKAGIEGVTVTADVYSTTTAADGTYSILVPPGTYNVTANGFDVGYSTLVKTGEVVTEGNTTPVDFTLNNEAPTLSGVAGFSYGNLTWTSASAKGGTKGTDIVMGSVETNTLYTPGATEDISFTLTFYTPNPNDPTDPDWIQYFEITLPDEFTINSATDFPDNSTNSTVTADITGQTVSWTTNGNYMWHQLFVNHEFTINVTSDALASGPQVCDYLLSGDGYTGDPGYFDGLVTIYEEGGAYVPTYNVYRVLDDGTGNVFIPLVSDILDMELYDVIHAGNWCYFVTQNLEDGTESARSNIVCLEILDPCSDAVNYGAPGDDPQTATLEYEEQVLWYSFTTLGGDVQFSTCGSDFNTGLALYTSCVDMPEYPDMVPTGASEVYTDGCDDAGQAAGAICGLEAGTYYVAVYGEDGETGTVELDINNDVQCLTILDNWSGWSLYVEPAGNDSIQNVLAEMAEEMIITIRQDPYGIWWVPENINTLGTVTPELGYKAKMDGEESTIVYGTEIADKTVTIPAGASYLPVRVAHPTDTDELAAQLGSDLLIVYNINNAAELYWPDGGLDLLPELLPDFAYQINVYNEVDFTYPTAKSNQPLAGSYTPAPYKGENVAWNEVINTGNPHFISIQKAATDEIMIGDLIGVFNGDGLCVGVTEVVSLDENLLVNAFGDDIYTLDVVDGLEEGELMTFKLYRPSLDEEYAVEVSWNAAMPNSDGLYTMNGMSMITNFKVGSTDITESEFANVSIYPNPSAGVFNIEGLQANTEVTVTNAQGQVVFSGDISSNGLLDMTAQPKGVYFVRLINEEEMMIQKVILK